MKHKWKFRSSMPDLDHSDTAGQSAGPDNYTSKAFTDEDAQISENVLPFPFSNSTSWSLSLLKFIDECTNFNMTEAPDKPKRISAAALVDPNIHLYC